MHSRYKLYPNVSPHLLCKEVMLTALALPTCKSTSEAGN